MVTLYFSHQSLVGGSTIGMGIKKAQAPSHTLTQACDSPNTTMVEVCAMERSFNVVLILFIKSRSRSQFVHGKLSNKKICIPFEMQVQSYELSMKIGHGGCFF